MTETGKDTTVVIVGGGVAGLALATFLLRRGIGCVVLEKHSRAYVERRQRAGALDADGVRVLDEWGWVRRWRATATATSPTRICRC